ncbi:MAG: ABC transporter [Bacteroidetes bacterium GWE2_29_8]|nr:MAG: ABC transporter [Bacteroidetes bacterium GWE2_29_8]OFY17899.1 MAG: ABC transporter [Bacteroidetes bacterium GWF2_29_10]
MYKVWISIKKEFYLLFNDKTGLSLMFLMPLILVFIITIIQDSAFKIINENKISLLIVNHDSGSEGNKLKDMLDQTRMFNLIENNNIDFSEVKKEISKENAMVALYIENSFSEKLNSKTIILSKLVMANIGMNDSVNKKELISLLPPTIFFFNDPVLQDNYCYSILNLIHSNLSIIENTKMLEGLYSEMGYDSVPQNIKESIINNKIPIKRIITSVDDNCKIPNSTQHNVPAWTIFAMFFMVVSLGSNIVKEKLSGSFIRLKTMPTNFALILFSKQIVYLFVAIMQVILIFSIGIYIFPLIKLPELTISSNTLGTFIIVIISGIAAVSYALMVGSISKTQEQSNGFGAISIIIFAALGGVWVPIFVMPEYMKQISKLSPLHWCIDGFYTLFLRDGNWLMLYKPILILLVFSLSCQIITYLKLKYDKLI